ncbi:MAG: hypothetical protein J5I93_14405 [Pirellulaceae bacterium]|nr:hypothetical protein [Pirellulaceae bacterium]
MNPDTVVHWKDLKLARTGIKTEDFAKQGNTTFALLLVNGTFKDQYVSEGGQCAEHWMLTSVTWVSEIERAVSKVHGPRPEPSSFLVALNRTPCNGHHGSISGRGGCSGKLVAELVRIRESLADPDRFDEFFAFTLACTGYYDGPNEEGKPMYGLWTTNYDILALQRAGWKVKALQVGKSLTARGRKLATWSGEIATSKVLVPDEKHPFVKEQFDRYMDQALKWTPKASLPRKPGK